MDGVDNLPSASSDALLTPLEAQERACPSARLNQGATKEQIAALEVPALALVLAVEAADRRRRQAEWLAQRLASFGHSPTRKDGRELECGHAFCRHGCAYCWLDASEKAAVTSRERRARRADRGKASVELRTN